MSGRFTRQSRAPSPRPAERPPRQPVQRVVRSSAMRPSALRPARAATRRVRPAAARRRSSRRRCPASVRGSGISSSQRASPAPCELSRSRVNASASSGSTLRASSSAGVSSSAHSIRREGASSRARSVGRARTNSAMRTASTIPSPSSSTTCPAPRIAGAGALAIGSTLRRRLADACTPRGKAMVVEKGMSITRPSGVARQRCSATSSRSACARAASTSRSPGLRTSEAVN